MVVGTGTPSKARLVEMLEKRKQMIEHEKHLELFEEIKKTGGYEKCNVGIRR